MTQLLIARHGNTFGPGDTPTRVGARTDLPLVESGFEQARRLGTYLEKNNLTPDIIYTSELKRTQQTAEYAQTGAPITALTCFNEIDYGPDENKPEDEVIRRIGQEAMHAWNQEARVPPGWCVNPKTIIQDWLDFGDTMKQQHPGKIILVVTSNGIARFAPYLTGDFAGFSQRYTLKLKTGALCSLKASNSDQTWAVTDWNLRP